MRNTADIGRTVNLLSGDYSPGIYFSRAYTRSDITNAIAYRLEIIDLDVLSTGTNGKITVYVQSKSNSSKSHIWRTISTSNTFEDIQGYEGLVTLNLDIFRFKILVEDSNVTIDLNAAAIQSSGNATPVQVNLPDKFLAGNEPTQNYDYLIVYKAGSISGELVDKIYKFPKGSVSGDPAIIKTFLYDVNDNFISLEFDTGLIP